jgi:anti-sigma B factor antagonist
VVVRHDDFHVSAAALENGFALVSAAGELDLYTSDRLRRAIAEAVELGGQTVLVDLSAVGFVDSSSLQMLARDAKRLEDRGRVLVVISNEPQTLRTLQMARLDGVIRRYASLHDALSELSAEADLLGARGS